MSGLVNKRKFELGPTEKHYSLALRTLLNLKEKKGIKILEVGAGPKILQNLLPQEFIYHSLDNAEIFWNEDYTYSHDLNKGKFPIKEGVYDVVICNETLEHILYPEKVLKEIMRVAKKDAIFLFSMPNEYNFISRLYFVMGKKTEIEEPFKVVEKGLHIHRPRVEDIISLFSRYLEIKKVDYSWQSRLSEKSQLARKVDGLFNWLAPRYPSLFSRTVAVLAVRKK